MKNTIGKIKLYAVNHKIISSVAFIIILALLYWGYKSLAGTGAEVQYITATVQKGTIISSVTASGQVEASNQIDIKPNVSGTITYIGVKPGDKVQKSKTLFIIDNKDALKTVRDAELNLQNANLSLQKLKIQNSDANLNTTLEKVYNDAFNTISNAFLDLPSIMTGLTDMFFKADPKTGQWNIDLYEGQVGTSDHESVLPFKKKFSDSYNIALVAYNKNFDDYKNISRTSDHATIENLISETYSTIELLADTIKNANNYIDFVNSSMQKHGFSIPAIITTHKTSLNAYTSQTNSWLSNIFSTKTSITDNKDSVLNSSLDMQSSELSIKQREDALQDAKDKLADYYVRAPFSGTMASVVAKVGDTASGTLGSIITNQKIATLSMNEVDVAKIKLGEKATITFDAVDGLSMTGSVAEIDALGTVSQGVVSYSVKIAFDTENDLVKPGMSVSASIITDSKTDILIIPASAIKNQGNVKYVQMFATPLPAPAPGSQGTSSKIVPIQVRVETGVTDDTNTEIISGLKEGDQIVSRTITVATTAKPQTSSLLGGISTRGIGGSGGNFGR